MKIEKHEEPLKQNFTYTNIIYYKTNMIKKTQKTNEKKNNNYKL